MRSGRLGPLIAMRPVVNEIFEAEAARKRRKFWCGREKTKGGDCMGRTRGNGELGRNISDFRFLA